MNYSLKSSILFVVIVLMGLSCCHARQETASVEKMETKPIEHFIVVSESGKFCGWPANNGVWTWDGGKEILVGFSYSDFDERSGHNSVGQVDPPSGIESLLARSADGGKTWTKENPKNFVGYGAKPSPAPGGIAFDQQGFALRGVGIAYHGAADPQGSFFYSTDRGHSWQGPYSFSGLMDDANLKDMENTTRTGYLVTGKESCLIFMSARLKEKGGGRDKSFVAETTDGGKTFHFVSWIVPLSDPYRAVMPSPVKLADGTIVVALRRRIPNDDKTPCWVDCYGSKDNGRTWSFLSRVGDTGGWNGNPPALAAMADGRIACAYGDRTRIKMFARLSADGGKTWGEEIALRDDYQPDKFGDKDFGYPRIVQNHHGELVAMYYWATKENFQHYIAATIWTAKKNDQ